ncbi:hypothetical protein L7F22_002044 [Adiantum nelumboides]|nr:hypothetical protein [Adiantum nelumboides]
MASSKDQSNPSICGDAGGDYNEDFGNEYGPPLLTQEELRKMERRKLIGDATNMMLTFTKGPNLAKYMTETSFQDTLDAQKKGKKHGKKWRKSTDFPGYLVRQSTFDKAKKHKKRVRFAEVPSSSSPSSDSSSDSSKEDKKGKMRSKKRHRKGKKKTRKSKSCRVDDSSTEEMSTYSSNFEDGHFYANKKNFYKANQYDFLEDKSKKVCEFKEGGQSIRFDTFSGYKDASKALSFIEQFIAFVGGRYSEHSKIRSSTKQDIFGSIFIRSLQLGIFHHQGHYAGEPADAEGSIGAGKRLLEGPADLPGSKRPKLTINPPVQPVTDIVPLTKPISVDILDNPVRSPRFDIIDFQLEDEKTTRLMIKRDKLQQLQKDSVKGKFAMDHQINPTLTYNAPTSKFILDNETIQSLNDNGVLAIQTSWIPLSMAPVNEAVVSYLGDLDNKSDEEGDDDDDEDKADEDHEDLAGPSGHQGNDDDNDDTDQQAMGPYGSASIDPPPPSTSHSNPPAPKGNDDHPQGTGAAGGQQDITTLVTYKKRITTLVSSTSKEMAISTMVSSTGAEMAKSTAMVPSSKGKEKATEGKTDSFNPWLHKEFHLAKQVQLREYLQADDMNTDMKKLAALSTGENDIFVNYFEFMPDPPALLYAMRMEETELPRFYPALYPPHTQPADQLTYIQIVEKIGDWWEKGEGLWKEWLIVLNEVEQKKTVKEFCTAVGEFKAGMRAWKCHMQGDRRILFEARVKANQPEPAGWLATASHCHKLARARVTKGKKTLYYPQTKEWLPMTPYEQQVLVEELEVLKQTAVYKIIKKQTAAQAMEAATSPQEPIQPRERKPPDKDKGKKKK